MYPCLLSSYDFTYALPVEESYQYYIRSGYIENWTPYLLPIDPLGTALEIYTNGDCPVVPPITYFSTDDGFANYRAGDETIHQWDFSSDQIGVS